MLDFVTRTSNPSHKKTAISSRYRSGFPSRYSRRVSGIGEAMDRGRPLPLNGALVVPKQRRFERIALTERGLRSATSAIQSVFRGLRTIRSRISSCCKAARFGAMSGAWLSIYCYPSPSLAPCRDSNVGVGNNIVCGHVVVT
jgi:hypothetical protein